MGTESGDGVYLPGAIAKSSKVLRAGAENDLVYFESPRATADNEIGELVRTVDTDGWPLWLATPLTS